MSIGRVVGLLVLIVVLYSVISQPQDSAASVRNGVGHLGDAGTQVVAFFQALVPDSNADGSVRIVPLGGAAAGDGSAAP